MNDQKIFERYELKFLVSEEQCKQLLADTADLICPDRYPTSTICNLYYDTPEGTLIRASLDHPVYKEKLRLRSYGVPDSTSKVFLELKKKYEDLVYKRRETFLLSSAEAFVKRPEPFSQITREIEYVIDFYRNLQPAMAIFYDRHSYVGADDPSLRITFDRDILYRNYDLDLSRGIYGERALPVGNVLMEVKCADAMPLWLCRELSALGVKKTSFSKYGKAYTDLTLQTGGYDYEGLVS